MQKALEQMAVTEQQLRIVDLGCGNGVLGLIAAAMNPAAKLLFCDETYMAIASAEENFRAAFGRNREAEYRVGDCLAVGDLAAGDDYVSALHGQQPGNGFTDTATGPSDQSYLSG